MSEANTNTTTENPPVVKVGEATRNGVTVDLVQQVIKRGPNKGSTYVAPATEALSTDQLVSIFGADEVKNILAAKLSAKAQGWSEEAQEEQKDAGGNSELVWDSVKSLTAYQQFFSEWSARGEKIADLAAEREDLVEKMVAAHMANRMEEATALAAKINSVSLAIKQKRRKTKEEEAVAQAV